jgi:hypothetical protein
MGCSISSREPGIRTVCHSLYSPSSVILPIVIIKLHRLVPRSHVDRYLVRIEMNMEIDTRNKLTGYRFNTFAILQHDR